MALIKAFEDKTGVEAPLAYWKIASLAINTIQKTACLWVSPYISSDARMAGRKPLESVCVEITDTVFDKYLSKTTLYVYKNGGTSGSKTTFSSSYAGAVDETLEFKTSYSGATNPLIGTIVCAPSNTGCRIILSTAQNGTGTLTERLRLDDQGNIGISNSTPGTLLAIGSALDAASLPGINMGASANRHLAIGQDTTHSVFFAVDI